MKLNKKLIGLFVVFAVLLSAGLLILSKRATPVRVSQTTTFIDSPLADDGLPNFAIAIVEKYRDGAPETLASPVRRAGWPKTASS